MSWLAEDSGDRCPRSGPSRKGRRQAILRSGDQVQAFRVLADVGLGREIRHGELQERLIAQVQVTRRWWKAKGLEPALLEELIAEMHEAWR